MAINDQISKTAPEKTVGEASEEKAGLHSLKTINNQFKKRILITEDEKDYRDILTERLREEGFEILQAEDGQQALDIMKTNMVDLILLDMLMPNMDGVTFLYHLRNDLGKTDIPIIILTNFSEAAYPKGVNDFIVKSNTSLDDVVTKVNKNIRIQV